MKLLTKKIGILGYGIEGKSLEKFLESRRVRDLKVYDEKLPQYPDFSHISDRDVLFRSPSVSPFHPELQNFRGKVLGGAELFLQLCPTKKVIGITGTKGKGTTSTLVTRMFEEANDTVYLLGNIGNPFFDWLPEIRTRDVAVLELSSFQLWDSEQSPQIAVLLRITPDHLEKHKDFNDYINAKKNIFLHQKTGGKTVYCADCPHASSAAEEMPPNALVPFSAQKELDKGVFFRGDEIVWKTEEGEEIIATKQDIRLRGDHNHENVLASVAAAKLLNVRTDPIKTAIQKFTGLPFRLQLIAANKDNNLFYNDSCATTPSATIAGLNTFTEPLLLVTGGSEKNVQYDELGKVISEHKSLKTIFLMGATGKLIRDAIGSTDKEIYMVSCF
jgi:UDP-N-acetylmuramoylalanine--D-glutamate ligase